MIEIFSEMRQFYKTPGKDTLKVKATHFSILTSIAYFLSNGPVSEASSCSGPKPVHSINILDVIWAGVCI